MIPTIPPISVAAIAPVAEAAAAKPAEGGNVFGQIFADAVNRVEQYRVNAETSVERFLSGEDQELHKVAMAAQQAELSFQLFLQVKNKAVQAYQDVMRMQL